MIIWPAKSPGSTLDYTWMPALDTGDTIVAFTATVTAGSATIATTNFTTTQGLVWLEGGLDGENITLILTVTTQGGRVIEEAALLPIRVPNPLIGAFRLQYPEFALQSDEVIRVALEGAALSDAWPDTAQDKAKMALAAHSIASGGVSDIPQGVTSFKSGTFSASMTTEAANRWSQGLRSTRYGIEYLALVRQYFGGTVIVAGPRCVC